MDDDDDDDDDDDAFVALLCNIGECQDTRRTFPKLLLLRLLRIPNSASTNEVCLEPSNE
jgi:hypothetical protein